MTNRAWNDRPPSLRPLARSLSGVGVLALALGALPWLSGCAITLEDGYKPKPLDATPEVRKSYYASPFTDEANVSAGESQPAPTRGGR